ncbi:hypothetical protein B9Z65_6224 [Elsinoe australis]|uniref:Wings apart-like protein C-terminal domain-containing protein n=1 Tax=Elsinoe australis TaxID=40998 RepID=A0A2P8A824_9PEZI|nr:hypothetical protein B9Z65_6224 [Elsinoe australis]
MVAIFGSSPQVEGRKKTVTYGKLARVTKRPAQRSLTDTTSEPSLARLPPRPKPAQVTSLGRAHTSNAPRQQTDDFDVPSSGSDSARGDDRTMPPKKTSNKLVVPPADEDTERAARPTIQSRMPQTKETKKSNSSLPSHTRTQFVTAQQSGGSMSPPKKRKRGDNQEQVQDMAPTKTYGKVAATKQSKQARVVETTTKHTASERSAPSKRSFQEGVSAPARLAKMIDETMLDEDIPAGTPQITPCRPTLKKTTSLTPKQNKLWDELLEPTSGPDLPRHKKSTTSKTRARNDSKALTEDQHPQLDSHLITNGRVRLADRLKQDSQKEESFEFSDDGAESDISDERTTTKGSSQSITVNSQGALGLRNTYAQNRSYLAEQMSLEDSLLMPLTDNILKPSSKSQQRDEMDLDSEDEPSQGIRSIHELRAAGSKKRFLDDMDILLDDIKDHTRSAWSKRRSALMELSSKLEDLDFAARFIDNAFVTTLAKQCRSVKPSDTIADSLLLVVLTQITELELPRHVTDELIPAATWVSESGSITNPRPVSSISKDRESNMSRISRDSYIEFMGGLGKSSFWRSSKPSTLTLDALALRALEGLVLKIRRNGHRQPILGSARTIEQVTSHVILANPDSDQLLERHLALSILEAESLSIASNISAASKSWTSPITKSLVSFLANLISSPSAQASDVTLVLRLLLNLTNNQSANCAIFASTGAGNLLLQHVGSVFSSQAKLADIDNATLDTLLLSLGLAINLAEHSDAVRRAALPNKEANVLTPLIKTFLQGQEASSQADSIEESRVNVAYGYLAVLLGNLCLNVRVKAVVEKEMGDLESLMRAVEEFLGYHRRVDRESQKDEEAEMAWESFTDRLGVV